MRGAASGRPQCRRRSLPPRTDATFIPLLGLRAETVAQTISKQSNFENLVNIFTSFILTI